jgi:aldehyde dehydrogenase (NAD+)
VDGGQRCAAASRIIVFDAVYDEFKRIFLEKVGRLSVGASESDDYGAIINQKRMRSILAAVRGAARRGVKVLCGGGRLTDPGHRNGYFIAPTVLENADPSDPVSCGEIFGPVVNLYRVSDLRQAIDLVNRADFKLASAIHTSSIHRSQEFIARAGTGVVRVNGPTHGSEPHVPFGGAGLSGNGWREPGIQALDFYSEWKQVSIDHDPAKA